MNQQIKSQPIIGSPVIKKLKQQQKKMEIKPKFHMQFKQSIYQVLFNHNYFICAAPAKIIVYSLIQRKKTIIKVCTTDYIIITFPPYLFGCIIGQFIYYYSQQALQNINKIIKIKISKLNVRALCNFNKGYFMGGYNRSPFPGGNITDRRTIYFLQNLTNQTKNKPLWEIQIPKSNKPISVLLMQNPFLVCYCQPNVYLINPVQKTILLSFQKQFLSLNLLQGRYALNCINMIGISYHDKSIISIDVQRFPIYGVQLNQYSQKARSICQSKQGIIYVAYKNTIFTYNIFKKDKKVIKQYSGKKQIIQIQCTPKNVLIVLILSKDQQEYQTQCTQEIDFGEKQKQIDNQLTKSLDFIEKQQQNLNLNKNKLIKCTSLNIDKQIQQRMHIQVFLIQE